jgi:hypothetical protein
MFPRCSRDGYCEARVGRSDYTGGTSRYEGSVKRLRGVSSPPFRSVVGGAGATRHAHRYNRATHREELTQSSERNARFLNFDFGFFERRAFLKCFPFMPVLRFGFPKSFCSKCKLTEKRELLKVNDNF